MALTEENPVVTGAGELTTTEDQLDLAKTAARKVSEVAFKTSSTPEKSIETATSALGETPFSPGAIAGAIEGGATGIKGDIKDIYGMTLESLNKSSDALQNASNYMMQLSQTPDLFNLMTADELEFLKSTGYPPVTFANKVAEYMKANPQQDTEIRTVGGRVVMLDSNTGEILKDIGSSTSGSTTAKTAWDMIGYTNNEQSKLRAAGFAEGVNQRAADIYLTQATDAQQNIFDMNEYQTLADQVYGEIQSDTGIGPIEPSDIEEVALHTYLSSLQNKINEEQIAYAVDLAQSKEGAFLESLGVSTDDLSAINQIENFNTTLGVTK